MISKEDKKNVVVKQNRKVFEYSFVHNILSTIFLEKEIEFLAAMGGVAVADVSVKNDIFYVLSSLSPPRGVFFRH